MKPLRQMLRQTLSPSVASAVAVLCAAVFVAGAPFSAWAAGVVGTGTPDSCTDAALDAALAGGGLVTFNCGSDRATIDISTGTGTKTIAADTIIDGGGLTTISGGNRARVFFVNSGVNFTVENVTIADGAECAGGGIGNIGTLTVTNSTFTGNSAEDHGSSGIDGCSGGAIVNEPGGTVTVTNSTFTGNSAFDGHGGAIWGAPGAQTLTVTNCTFTGNRALWGGAITNAGGETLTVTNSTFTGNSAGYEGRVGGGIILIGTSAVFRNTIVANNTGGNCSIDPGLVIEDDGHNLDDGTSCGFSAANGSLSNTDPQLDPAGLRDNGGPTQTVALCTGPDDPAGCQGASPAINAGDQAICAAAPVNHLDQRGFWRPGGCASNCSIGAYEVGDTLPICEGDCDGNRRVTVDELIEGVNIALGTAPLTDCLPFDCQSAPDVLVACVVQAVNAALDGVCIVLPPFQFEGCPGSK